MAIAKIAVAAATYWLDKPYDYKIPPEISSLIVPGMRVNVPFGRGNHKSEGVVLSVTEHSDYEDKLKYVVNALDVQPVLSQAQLKLAPWMHDRFFCTVYDAVKTMLPAGMWFTSEGKKKINDKYTRFVNLAVPAEDAAAAAENKRHKAPQQAELLKTLAAVGSVSAAELLSFTGAKQPTLKALIKAGLVEEELVETFRRPRSFSGEILPLPTLNKSQSTTLEGISSLCDGTARAALLFGVTGSGKTSIYIHLISKIRNSGKSAILLVPEIALTPQMLETFSNHFGDEIAVLHSRLSAGERYDEWKRIKSGEARVVIGTRSAVFAPVEELGIVIIDEEQEDSYKSENTPRYHARDIAKYLCAREKCLLLLGSATPDIESRYSAEIGKYSFFTLPERYNERALPQVEIVDMKRELRRGNGGDISSYLRDELQKNIDCGEQSILFLNRRGANKLISCGECGYTYKCPHCSVALTYHSANDRLMCHYCGHVQRVDETCPDCGGRLKYIGSGTQRIEKELGELFPNTELLRMDADTVAAAGGHEPLLDKFRQEKIPILIGTQMVTKGLNLENVTLVGVISADQSLYVGDYRAGERTFSLITQVVGRSGRGERPGRAVIQTMTPDNETIMQAAQQDYDSFYNSEIQLRRLQNAPPFSDFLAVTTSSQEEGLALKCAAAVRDMLLDGTRARADVSIIGPAPLNVVKVNNRFRYRVHISCRADSELRRLIGAVVIKCSTDKEFRGVSVYADNNPTD